MEIKEVIAKNIVKSFLLLRVLIEVDESYFGAKRVKGERGRGTSGKIKVFGIFKREDKVYQIVDNCSRDTLHATIKERVSTTSTINFDG
jgi:transposase